MLLFEVLGMAEPPSSSATACSFMARKLLDNIRRRGQNAID
jgi:hypothetical protein